MLRHSVVLTVLFLLAGCAGDPSVAGTYAGTASVPLPSPPLPELDLMVAADLTLAADGTFVLTMDLAAGPLTDAMDVRGTYVTAGGMLTLEPNDIVIPAGSMNVRSEGANGEPCVALAGFASTIVCLPSPQTRPYTVAADTLSITLDSTIAGVEGREVPLMLTRMP